LVFEKWPFFILAAGSCVLTFLAQRSEAVVSASLYPVTARIANAVVAYVDYLLKTFWPIALAPIYPMALAVPRAQVAGSTVLLVAVSWLCWRARRSRPHLLVGWLWFLGTLVPVIGLVQVGSQTLADRYTYIPSMGLLLALTIEIRGWVSRRQLRPGPCIFAAGFILTACLCLSARQIGYWTDGQTLFTRTVAITRDNPLAQYNLAIALEKKGAQVDARQHYEEALRLNPALPEAHHNLGDLLSELGKTNEAIFHYRESLRVKEDQPVIHENLGALLVKRGAFDEAMTHYARAAQLDPQDARPNYLMGKALLRQGRTFEALDHFRDALHRDPNDLQTLVYSARVMAADPDPHARNGPESTKLAEHANVLSGDSLPFMLDTLAMAYAEAGRFAEARSTQQRALDRAAASGETEAIEEMRQRLRLYESDQAYRESFAKAQGP
jgi:tetratricopeptide (TPR) repeat protein